MNRHFWRHIRFVWVLETTLEQNLINDFLYIYLQNLSKTKSFHAFKNIQHPPYRQTFPKPQFWSQIIWKRIYQQKTQHLLFWHITNPTVYYIYVGELKEKYIFLQSKIILLVLVTNYKGVGRCSGLTESESWMKIMRNKVGIDISQLLSLNRINIWDTASNWRSWGLEW